jgi:HAD superfamily hydrolase (TIGR01484 family)
MKKTNITYTKPMVVTDLDGTLFNKNGKPSEEDRKTLIKLGNMNIITAIATGRNLFSARKVIQDDFPIDYLIFSSGAGIMDWKSKSLIKKYQLDVDEVKTTATKLIKFKHDFMVHHTIPDNHYFAYYHNGKDNPDFFRRIDLYKNYAYRKDYTICNFGKATQFVIIDKGDECLLRLKRLTEELKLLKVIRTTSPLDGNSLWVEVFPITVSKSKGAELIAEREQVNISNTMSIGNDFNDLDLLNWSSKSYVVDNSPYELKDIYNTVSSNNDSGFTQAVNEWLSQLSIDY